MNPFPILIRIAAGFVLATLAACGGGGGGGGGVTPVVYSGITGAAAITAFNASTIVANIIGGSDAGTIIGGVSVESGNAANNQATGPADIARRLGRKPHDIAVRAIRESRTQQLLAGAAVTEGCESGSIQVSGTLNPDGTGTLSLTFINCAFAGVTINGPATLRIDATVFIPDIVPTDFTLSFARLTLRGTTVSLSIDAGGSIRFQDMGNALRLTMNLDEMNNITGKMRKTVNLVIDDVYDNIFFPTTLTETLTGRVFHSDHGFVDIGPGSTFVFGPPIQLFPTSGQMLLTGATAGAGNLAIRVTALTSPPAALPATLARLELDLDGDGAFNEIDARLLWTQLDGLVGSDLRDNDQPIPDGMHNSWETFYGLDPAVDDAAGDKDVDGQTNIQEYLAGTTP